MKRMHLHVAVDDLAQSIRFYSTLFGAAPTISKPDYAKWMLEDPRVNFAISQRGVQDPSGLAWEAYRTLDSAPTFNEQPEQEPAACCSPALEKVQFIPRKGKAA